MIAFRSIVPLRRYLLNQNLFWNQQSSQRLLCTAGISGSTSPSAPVTNFQSAPKENPKSTSTSTSGVFRSMLRTLFRGRLIKQEITPDNYALQTAAIKLYSQCANLDFLPFINRFKIQDTLGSWFLITGLHMWFILLRLRQEPEEKVADYVAFRDDFVNVLWHDVKRRFEAISRNQQYMTSKTIRKETDNYYDHLMSEMMELDEGIMCDDMVLAGALWRIFYKNQQIDDVVALNDLVRYVRMQVHGLNQRSIEDVITNGVQKWEILSN